MAWNEKFLDKFDWAHCCLYNTGLSPLAVFFVCTPLM